MAGKLGCIWPEQIDAKYGPTVEVAARDHVAIRATRVVVQLEVVAAVPVLVLLVLVSHSLCLLPLRLATPLKVLTWPLHSLNLLG